MVQAFSSAGMFVNSHGFQQCIDLNCGGNVSFPIYPARLIEDSNCHNFFFLEQLHQQADIRPMKLFFYFQTQSYSCSENLSYCCLIGTEASLGNSLKGRGVSVCTLF